MLLLLRHPLFLEVYQLQLFNIKLRKVHGEHQHLLLFPLLLLSPLLPNLFLLRLLLRLNLFQNLLSIFLLLLNSHHHLLLQRNLLGMFGLHEDLRI